MPSPATSPTPGTVPTRFTRDHANVALGSDNKDAIAKKYAALGGAGGFLGAPTAAEEDVAGGRRRTYEGGHIYWSPDTGAWAVWGGILARYLELGGAPGLLGFPTTDEVDGARPGSRVSRFTGGGIWWSAQTGAREVHGAMLGKYLAAGAEGGVLGLPISDEVDQAPGGRRVNFQGGAVVGSAATGAFALHGSVLGLFNALGAGGTIGLPLSDVTDVRGVGGTAGQLARFANGTIYWSPTTGACAVQGLIRDQYEALGGPGSEFGFPTTHETSAGPVGVRYHGFQHGVIAWSPATGVVAVSDLELHLGWVRSGPVEDGPGDSSAELVTYTTVRVNGQPLETNVRRPGGHAGTSLNLDARYAVPSVRFHTTVSFEVKVDDWDRFTSNDYVGTFRRTLDVSTLWGLAEPGQGVFVGVPLAQKGAPARSLTSVRLDFAVRATRPAPFDPTKTFREQSWWRFANFSTPSLSKQQYADTFRDVGHRTNWVEKAVHPWDSLFYLAYEGVAAKGNCFGMSLEGALAATGRSLYGEPVSRFGFDAGLGATVNHKHGYQLGDASVRWTLAKLATLDAVQPTQVYENVRAALARRDWPLLSMFELAEFRGHTVLAYECPPVAPGQPLVIRVADPNHPHLGGALHPTWVEVDPAANTFKFVTPNGVTFQSTRVVNDLLPGTLMFETPVSRVAGQPRTPFWEFAALLAAVGGLILVAGDAEAGQLTADGTPLYAAAPDGARAVAPGGAGGWMRLPLFDHTAAAPPQLFANLSRPTERLELALGGRGGAGAGGAGHHYLRTPRHAVLLDAPAGAGTADTLRVLRAGGAEPRVEFDTAGEAKDVTVGVGAILDAGRSESAGAIVRLGAAAGMTAFVQPLGDGAGVIVRSAGAARPLELEFERTVGDRAQRVALTVPPGSAGEAVAVRAEDPASPMGEMRVERVDAEGKPTGGPVRVQPRPVDPRRSGLVRFAP